MHDIDPTERIEGPYGTVDFIPLPDIDDPDLDVRTRAVFEVSEGTWLITAPAYHPVWSQYMMSAVGLADHPDLGDAYKKFPGATHELLVAALHPDTPVTVASMQEHCKRGDAGILQPINIAEQFECTSDEIKIVAWLAGRAVVYGQLNPETGDAPERIREQWLTACVKTLAHIRGEAHAP